MRAFPSYWRGLPFQLMLAVTLVALFHGAALGFDLLWDDLFWVDDFRRHSLLNLLQDNLTRNTLVSYYRPLVAASLSLQLALSQSPVFLHAFNLALHAVNLCLVALIAHQGSARGALRVPLVITVLAIHPVLVEPVVWVSGRFDLFYTTFLLLSLLAALRVRRAAWRWPLVSLGFLAALVCKESALVYGLVGPMLFAIMQRDTHEPASPLSWRSHASHGFALGAAVAAYLALRILALELPLVRDTAFQVHDESAPGAHALLVLRTFGTYLQMTLLPLWNLAPLHAVSDDANSWSAYAAAGAACLVAALAGLRWRPCLPVTIWCVALLPAANLVPFRLDLVQCRYLYFPMFAAALAALQLRGRPALPARSRPLAGALLGLWLLALAATTLSVVPLWRDGVSLFSWVVSMRPASRYALENLALAHQAAGQYADAIEVESRIAPRLRSFQGWLLLARASRDHGELEAAREYFQRALATPAYDDAMQVSALYELALVHKKLGNPEASARTARDAEALAARTKVSALLCDYYRRALGE